MLSPVFCFGMYQRFVMTDYLKKGKTLVLRSDMFWSSTVEYYLQSAGCPYGFIGFEFTNAVYRSFPQ